MNMGKLLSKHKLKTFNIKHFSASFFIASRGISSITMLYQFSYDLTLCLSPIMIHYFPNLCQFSCCSPNSSTFSIFVGVSFNRSLKLPYQSFQAPRWVPLTPYCHLLPMVFDFSPVPHLYSPSTFKTLPCLCYTFVVVLPVHFSSDVFL